MKSSIEFLLGIIVYFVIPLVMAVIGVVLCSRKRYVLGACLAGVGSVLLVGFFGQQIVAKKTMLRNKCTNNLRQIDAAKEQWAMEKHKTATDTPTWEDLVGPTKFLKGIPVCPANGDAYTLGTMQHKPTCSISDHTLQ